MGGSHIAGGQYAAYRLELAQDFSEKSSFLLDGIGPERDTGGVANELRMGNAAPGKPAMARGSRWIVEIGTGTEENAASPCGLRSCLTRARTVEERDVTEEQVRATVEQPDLIGEGNHGRLVADRRFGRSVVRVVYNVGHGKYVIVAVMRRRRLGGGGGP